MLVATYKITFWSKETWKLQFTKTENPQKANIQP